MCYIFVRFSRITPFHSVYRYPPELENFNNPGLAMSSVF